MIKKIFTSFLLAFHNIRSNFFHTILSVLGIVIGVAALVAILSLIDGMEKFARGQITKTTSLKSIVLQTEQIKRINNVRIRKDTFAIVDYAHYRTLSDKFQGKGKVYFRQTRSTEIHIPGKETATGLMIYSTGELTGTQAGLELGKSFTKSQIDDSARIGIINHAFSMELKNGRTGNQLLDSIININNLKIKIVGILKDDSNKTPQIYMPITLVKESELRQTPPVLVIEANKVEDVPILRKELESYLKDNYESYKDDFSIFTYEARVKQVTQAFLLFRVIMGLIVGISILVGGIGVMNVLLISVTERTAEIGIRKAVGANRLDIVMQFLCESVTVSAVGSLVGLITGVLGTLIIIPIIRFITKAPFQAAFTLNTILVIASVALAVGIIFGTYPALRASKLNPVEAIRRE